MIKTTIAALLLTTSAAVALEDRNNFNVNYTDFGTVYQDTAENLDTDALDTDNVTIGVDGRNGVIEYGVSVKEQQGSTEGVAGEVDAEFNVGVAVPVTANTGVVAGVSKDFVGTEDAYVGAIYEAGRVEARYTYQENAEDHKVSGRFYVTDRVAVNAGVQFDDVDDIGEDSRYTVGLSFKF